MCHNIGVKNSTDGKGVVTMGAHIKSKKEKFETHMNQTGGNENVRS